MLSRVRYAQNTSLSSGRTDLIVKQRRPVTGGVSVFTYGLRKIGPYGLESAAKAVNS